MNRKKLMLIVVALYAGLVFLAFHFIGDPQKPVDISQPQPNTEGTALVVEDAEDALLAKVPAGTKRLEVHGSKVTAAGLGVLAGLGDLEELSLRCPGTTIDSIKHLRTLTKLRSLELDYGEAAPGMHSAGGFTLGSLNELPIERLSMKAYLLASGYLTPLVEFHALRELYLECEEFYDSPLISQIRDFKSLKILSVIVRKPGTGTLLDHVGQLEGLESLKLTFELNASDLAKLAGCRSLSRLDLSGTKVVDADLEPLSELKSLKTLDLRGTPATGEALKAKLPQLEVLR